MAQIVVAAHVTSSRVHRDRAVIMHLVGDAAAGLP